MEALRKRTELLGTEVSIVSIANRSDGFVHRSSGIAPGEALERNSISEIPGTERWPTALEGLAATEADILVEVTQSPAGEGEPGLSHMRHALERGMAVATSNKWPVALAGVELAELARERGAGFRAESTVMSGTPVLSALTGGIAGARPIRLRGVLNATVNQICTRVDEGVSYVDALREAQAMGLAEPDPSQDVDGFDSVAKLMILSALAFGEQLAATDVVRHGISELGAIAEERDAATRLREVVTLDPGAGVRSVEVLRLEPGDPLHGIEGSDNAVLVDAEPIGEILIRGPGAGPKLAGQGVLSDVIALARPSQPARTPSSTARMSSP